MRLLHSISEDEVIATFLRGEIGSSRYGEKLGALLARDGCHVDVLRYPDLADPGENEYRRRLLDEHRAYDQREGLFLGFPRDVDWFRATLDRDEILDILYIDWDWWLMLSGGSRRPRDAARRIRAGEFAGVSTAEHEPLADALRAGSRQPELIAVTTPAYSPVVLVEGPLSPNRLRPSSRPSTAGDRDPPGRLRQHHEVVSVLAGAADAGFAGVGGAGSPSAAARPALESGRGRTRSSLLIGAFRLAMGGPVGEHPVHARRRLGRVL